MSSRFSVALFFSVSVSLALVVILRYFCSTGDEPATLRVRGVRLNHRGDVEVEGSSVGRSRVSDRLVVSRGAVSLIQIFGWPFEEGASVAIQV